jgi:hypothetical protein
MFARSRAFAGAQLLRCDASRALQDEACRANGGHFRQFRRTQ